MQQLAIFFLMVFHYHSQEFLLKADLAHTDVYQIFDLVISLNGTLSGEHGIGREKRAYVDKEIDPTTMNLMKNIKQVFDPNNILNPGKLFLRDS